MYGLLITLSIIISILLMIVILLQAGKGDGLAGIAGGAAGGMSSTFGSRRTADFLSKSTWYLGGAILVLAVVINLFFLPGSTTQAQRESVIQSAQQQTAVPTQPALPVVPPSDSSN